MASLVKVQYVGNKPTAFDNVAHSRKVWKGNGDIQEVTEAQAKILIKYPDQWALASLADVARVSAPSNITVQNDETGETVVINPDNLDGNALEKMSKDELKAYAKQKWDKELDGRKSTKLMIDQIEEWERDLNITNGPRPD